MKKLPAVLYLVTITHVLAQVPQLINYQGRVSVGTTNFNGTGQFKFALVNAAGTTTFWSNDGTSNGGSQPTNAVSLPVINGLYSVLLGDTTLANMMAVPASVFNNSDVRLRVWFNDGTNGSQLLIPDRRLAAVGYAMIAGTVPDGALTGAKLANGAVTSAKIDSTTVQQRVTGSAPPGSFITGINQNGTVMTSPAGGGPFLLNGTTAYYNGGMVGIGTSTPPAIVPSQLTVQTSGANSYGIEHSNGAVRLATFLGGTSSSGGWLGTVSNDKLNFFVNNGGASMTVNTDGYVGIGTALPNRRLQVSGDVGINANIFGATVSIGARAGDNYPLYVTDSSNANFLILQTNGASPHELHLFGEAFKTTGGSWGSNSDARVKKNIQPLGNALEKLSQLQGVSFDWINPTDHGNQTTRQAGFVAQEVERVFPHWISTTDAAEDDRSLTDDGRIKNVTLPFEFDALVVEAIKDQQQQIKQRDAEIAEIRERLDGMEKLMKRLDELEAKERAREGRLTKLEQSVALRALSRAASSATRQETP